MKSRTSLFNRTIIGNLWQRYWVLFAAYGFVMSLTVLPPLMNGFQSGGNLYRMPDYVAVWTLLNDVPTYAMGVNFVAAPVIAALLFSFLYTARHTGLMASLPVKRETMYLSVCAAGMLGMLLADVIVAVLALLIELVYGGVHLGALAILLGLNGLYILIFFGMAALCCMLTGNIFAGPAVYLIFNFVAVVVELMVKVLLERIVFGYEYLYDSMFIWLSPVMNLSENFRFSGEILRDPQNLPYAFTWSFESLYIPVIYALVGLLLLALGLKLYKNRRMETAGDTIAIEVLKPVFRFCMTVGGGLVFTCGFLALFYDIIFSPTGDAVCIGVLLIIGGMLGYFIAKMLIGRTVKVFDHGWKAVGIYAVAAALVVTAVECNLFGYETHVPDFADVESVSVQVYDGNGAVELKTGENITDTLLLHENILAGKRFHEADMYSVPAMEPSGFYRNETVKLTYTLTDGSTVVRKYKINYGPEEIRSADSEVRLLEAIMNTEEAIHARNYIGVIPEDTQVAALHITWIDDETFEWKDFGDLSPSQISRLYFDCVVPDILDGGLGEYSLILDEEWAKRTSTIQLNFDIPLLSGNGGRNYLYFNFNVDVTAKRTMAFMENLGIHAATEYTEGLHDHVHYNDLGSYTVDEAGNWYDPDNDVAYRESVGIIGGADGPTTVYVTK